MIIAKSSCNLNFKESVCDLVVLILELRAPLILTDKSLLQYEENQQRLEIEDTVILLR